MVTQPNSWVALTGVFFYYGNSLLLPFGPDDLIRTNMDIAQPDFRIRPVLTARDGVVCYTGA